MNGVINKKVERKIAIFVAIVMIMFIIMVQMLGKVERERSKKVMPLEYLRGA